MIILILLAVCAVVSIGAFIALACMGEIRFRR